MKINLQAEVQLDPTLQFFPKQTDLDNPQQIFLTGVSGFLGAYLLKELLQQTQASVHCLLRCQGENEGWQRLEKHLQFYQVWDEHYRQRLNIIPGDLAKPLLGLRESDFQQLAERVEAIYHSAAHVNAFYSYSALKASNVEGTQEILRLAAAQRSKPLHFISTLAVFFSPPHIEAEQVKETDIPAADLKGGYKQSKWVAEALVREAQARGLPASIYRTARIMGDSVTGINGNTQDFLCSFLKACVHLQLAPAADAQVNMLPVDFTAQAIVGMSRDAENLGSAFHLLNPISNHWNELYAALEQSGYLIPRVPFAAWLDALKQATQANPRDKTYAPVSFLLRSPTFLFAKKPPFDDAQTRRALAKLALDYPSMNTPLLKLYMDYFKNSGFF